MLCGLLVAAFIFINLSEKDRSVAAGSFGNSRAAGYTFSSLSSYVCEKYADE